MALDVMFYEPYAKTFLDEQAQARSIDYNLGWFMEPVFRGHYPFSMRSLLGDRLPYFKDDEQEKLVGSYDMMGLNYYTSLFCEHVDISPEFSPEVNTEDAYATPKCKSRTNPTASDFHKNMLTNHALLFFCSSSC